MFEFILKKFQFKFSLMGILPLLMLAPFSVQGQGEVSSNLKKVIIWFSPSGHGNTPALNNWIARIGEEHGFEVEATNDPTKFTTQNLRNYDVIYSVNGDFFGNKFSPEQKSAVENFYASGKGLGCLHQCNRAQGSWKWYMDLMACDYKNHAGIVPADVYMDPEGEDHDSQGSILEPGEKFNYREEWYNPSCNPRGLDGVKIIWTVDESTISGGGGTLGDDHPMAWVRDFGGGRYAMNLGGHTDEIMTNDVFTDHMLGTLKYLAGYSGCMDSKYAEYNPKATNQPPGACATEIVEGCMDPAFQEFDPDATVEPEGACATPVVSTRQERPAEFKLKISSLEIVVPDLGNHSIEISNAMGKRVYNATGHGETTYSSFNLEQGIYIIRIVTESREFAQRVLLY